MKFVSFYFQGARKQGVLDGSGRYVYEVSSFSFKEPKGEAYKLEEIVLDIPIAPSSIICTLANSPAVVGARSKDEAREMVKSPKFFLKIPTVAIAHRQPIISPKDAIRPEVEIAIITGDKKIKNVNRSEIQKYILGYSVFNDITYPPGAKEDGFYAYRKDPTDGKLKKVYVGGLHFRNKVRDTFAPFGPWIVTPEEIDDINSLSMKSYYGNELIQEGSSEDFIFTVEEILVELSKIITIPPYSVISSGSIGYKNAEDASIYYLKPINNKLMIAEIEKIGRLENPTVIE